MKRIEVNVQTGKRVELDVLPGEIPLPVPFALDPALERLKRARAPILNALAGVGFDAIASGDAAARNAVLAARTQLKNLANYAPALAATSDEQFNSLILARYRELVAQAPAAVQDAFREVALQV
jgi:hypothetical protein